MGHPAPFFGSVRMRLTLWNVAVLALALVIIGALVLYRMQADGVSQTDAHLMDIAAEFQRRLPPGEPPFPPPPRPEPPSDGTNHPPPPPDNGGPTTRFRPAAFDVNGGPLFLGRPAAAWDKDGAHNALGGRTCLVNVTVNGEPLRVYSMPLRREGRTIGVVQTADTLAPQQASVRALARTLLTLIPLAVVIAALGGLFLTESALRPVRQITERTAQIEAANLAGRLPITGTDEFGQLASTFNAMLERLQTAFSQMEQAFQQQRRFTGDASHELRTPLTIIKANTSLALSEDRTPAQYRHALAATDTAADRMNRIVQDLLLLARSDADQTDTRHAPLDLREILTQAAEPLQTPGRAVIVLRLPPVPLTFSGDADALRRLFSNLLTNALRHTPPNGTVTVRALGGGETACVDVADTGEGIDPRHLPHLTERFYRADDARARADGGTGLGLAICLSIAQAHGGTLTIQSQPGQGTTVRVTLANQHSLS